MPDKPNRELQQGDPTREISREILEASLGDGSANFILAPPNNSVVIRQIGEIKPLQHVELDNSTQGDVIATIDFVSDTTQLPPDKTDQALYYNSHAKRRMILIRGSAGEVALAEADTLNQNPHKASKSLEPSRIGESDDHYSKYWVLTPPKGGEMHIIASKDGDSVIISSNYETRDTAGMVCGRTKQSE